ncbi:mycothiol conjugate amidase Mca [Acaricomes phytoseiuli]|uniref:mycothiol conjugate amidase Mca n=1 Tax=Acaricomes phytoseiuli TaxID=291968 RepID=UPI00037EDF51|nr:mycothiol conjugate amidase Mca [Acaricomes phytoseiuli]MCW1250004.1 mycothiol conjugate amidase Mca [Acaricomes phytoseiuli]
MHADGRAERLPESAHEGLRLLAVHAHPDDESSKGAATMAAYAAQGVKVMVATCTGGERGDVQNPAMEGDPRASRDMAGLRWTEMAKAAQALEVEQRWLGFMDSGLPEGDPLPPLPYGAFATLPIEQAAAPLVRLVREFRPQVILSYDENGGYGHPDHIMAHRVAVEAFHAAGDPERYPGLGEPWSPSKLYYDLAFSQQRFQVLHQALLDAGMDSPYEEIIAMMMAEQDSTEDVHGERPQPHQVTTKIDCGDYFPVRDEALRAHASQVDPEGFFFAVPTEMQRKVWPWEDYALAESRVPATLPENDFFAGLR